MSRAQRLCLTGSLWVLSFRRDGCQGQRNCRSTLANGNGNLSALSYGKFLLFVSGAAVWGAVCLIILVDNRRWKWVPLIPVAWLVLLLVLRTEAGPADDNTGDWGQWQAIRFHRDMDDDAETP